MTWLAGWWEGGFSLDEINTLFGVLVGVGTVAVAVWQFTVRRPWRWLSGGVERGYAREFERRWGAYENRYLRQRENLKIRRTYVPLSLEGAGIEARPAAIEVLSNRDLRNIVVVGDVGSGKSTLLRAFGIGDLRRPGPAETRRREVAFLVQLRRFATEMENGPVSLAEYLIADARRAGMVSDLTRARRLLRRALRQDRLVVLLDGLDEVPQDRQDTVLQAVYHFKNSLDQEQPTGRARIALTCRRQNFADLRDAWEPVMRFSVYPGTQSRDGGTYEVVTIAPLTDNEIDQYLQGVRSEFADQESGARTFFQAVRASGTLDLHRVPLVLAMSVNMYAERTAFEIPTEISALYEKMVTEMLERHSFRDQPGVAALRFRERDKRAFLREFAAANALGRDGLGESFGEFPRRALYRFARVLAPALQSVAEEDAELFVDEIVHHSGLILKSDDGDSCVFAHRSIQEHLVAQQLCVRRGAGADLLLRRSAQSQWRQVFAFYVGADGQPTADVDGFLRSLAAQNLPLAGSCLVSADCSNEVADQILSSLADRVRADERVIRAYQSVAELDTGPDQRVEADQRVDAGQRADAERRLLVHVAAMLDASQSARRHVRHVAGELAGEVLEKIISLGSVFQLLEADLDQVVRVIEALARTRSPGHVASVAPKVAAAAADPRLVGPLWRCLSVPGVVAEPGADRIVERLLTLVMEPKCLNELQVQEQYVPDFVTPGMREETYPFLQGVRRDSNLVTLLCWADHLDVEPDEPNRYFQARRADRARFQRAEDSRRVPRVSLFWPARVASAGGAIMAVAVVVVLLVSGWPAVAPAGFSRAGLWWIVAPVLVGPLVVGALARWARRRPDDSRAHRYLRPGTSPETGDSGSAPAVLLAMALPDTAAQLTFLASTVLYAFALSPLLAVSSPGVFVGASLLTLVLLCWSPFLSGCDRGERIYLHRQNPLDEMYADPRSRHWITQDHGVP